MEFHCRNKPNSEIYSIPDGVPLGTPTLGFLGNRAALEEEESAEADVCLCVCLCVCVCVTSASGAQTHSQPEPPFTHKKTEDSGKAVLGMYSRVYVTQGRSSSLCTLGSV